LLNKQQIKPTGDITQRRECEHVGIANLASLTVKHKSSWTHEKMDNLENSDKFREVGNR